MPKAKVGISAPSASQLPTMLAKDKGFYAQNGVDADVVSIFGGTATDALIAGQIQTLQISTKVIQADLAGADLVYIGAPVPTDRFWLFADPSISDVKALKGKRIGVTGVGTATYVSAKLVLAASGLDPNKDVTLASLTDESTILAAVQNGAVDAGMMAVSGMLKAQKAGLKELLDTSKLNVPFPSGWNAVSKKYAAAHPDVVRAYMRSIAQAVAFELQNPAQTEQQLGKFLKSDDAELMKATYEQGIAPIMQKNLALDLDAVKNALNDLSSSVPAAKTADPAAFIDDTYVKEMESSGFIASLYKS